MSFGALATALRLGALAPVRCLRRVSPWPVACVGPAVTTRLVRLLLMLRRHRRRVRHCGALRQVFARQGQLGFERAFVDAFEHAEVGARERAAFPRAQERDALAAVTVLRIEGFAALAFLFLLYALRFLGLLLRQLVRLLVRRALGLFGLAI